jgi:hypothetical protein
MSDDMIKSSLNNKRVRPRFQLNVDKAVSELNIPREEAIRIAQLPSDQQKLALQKYHGYKYGTKSRVNEILT